MQKKPLILALLAGLSLSGAAQATLIDRGGGLIYDDVLNVTWLQNANLFKTQYDANNDVVNQIIAAVPTVTTGLGTHTVVAGDFDTSTGKMDWWGALAWADWLSYSGYGDWRLPFVLDTGSPGCNNAYSGTDCGYNVQTASGGTTYSELAYMYYVNLGLKGKYNPDVSARTDWGIFGNGTYNGVDQSSWGQNDVGLIDNLQAYAYWSGSLNPVDSGNVWTFNTSTGNQGTGGQEGDRYAWAVRSGDVAAVPEPATLLLLGLGLAGLGAMRRRG